VTCACVLRSARKEEDALDAKLFVTASIWRAVRDSPGALVGAAADGPTVQVPVQIVVTTH